MAQEVHALDDSTIVHIITSVIYLEMSRLRGQLPCCNKRLGVLFFYTVVIGYSYLPFMFLWHSACYPAIMWPSSLKPSSLVRYSIVDTS